MMTKPKFITLDFETRSAVDLRSAGVYRYAEDASTDVWCMAYAFDDGPVQLWRMHEPFPMELHQALEDGAFIRAWNAQFERLIWQHILTPHHNWPEVANNRFVCAMVAAAAAGLPMGLDGAAEVLRLDARKDKSGVWLMRQMAKPRSTDVLGRHTWWDDEERLERLYAYCKQDVVVEREIWKRLPASMDRRERKLYLLDQTINDRGVALDSRLIASAIGMVSVESSDLNQELKEITAGRVTSYTKVPDLRKWLESSGVVVPPSLDKAAVAELLADDSLTKGERRALEIRQEGAKTSTGKYDKMATVMCGDGRAHGLLQYYGAGTGRWAGRLIQPQNMPKGKYKMTADLIRKIHCGDLDALREIGPVKDVLSSALRGALIPSKGKVFLDADYNAIEARVVAWLAGETKLVKLFASGGKVYEDLASQIFGVPVSAIKNPSSERDMGKSGVLGGGFGMGPVKFSKAANVDIELAERIIKTYRGRYPHIPQFWYDLSDAALHAVRTRSSAPIRAGKHVTFRCIGDWLTMGLPSGRSLWYHSPRVVLRPTPWGEDKPAVEIDRRNRVTGQWEPVQMYGGIWAENATQATARDIMVEGLFRTEAAGFETVLTIHDEVLAEGESAERLDEFVRLLSIVPEWAEGCPIKAEGWTGDRYRK